MKKIGILTFHRTNNYGAVLQNYALQKAISREVTSCQVETVNYINEFIESPYKKPPFSDRSQNTLKNTFYWFRYLVNLPRYNKLCSEFDSFRKRYISTSREYTKQELINNSNDYDIYVTGSDQVWNDKITNGDSIYSLGFLTDAKKISYAASSGAIDCIGKDTLRNIKMLDKLSVREKDLEDYLEASLRRDVLMVLDPVFLLNRQEWEEILEPNRIIEKSFIFTYSVSEMTDEVVKLAKLISSESKCEIVHLDHSMKYGFRGKLKYGASPQEFLRYIRDAEYVIASSFHAVAFSIIFGKRFIVIPTKKTASRMTNLLAMLDAEDNLYNSYADYLINRRKIVEPDIGKLLPHTRQSLEFIKTAIV